MSDFTLKQCADYINEKIYVKDISLQNYITTDNILQNKQGVQTALSLPAQEGKLNAFKKDDILLANIRPYLKKFGTLILMVVAQQMFWLFVPKKILIVAFCFMRYFVMIFLFMQ